MTLIDYLGIGGRQKDISNIKYFDFKKSRSGNNMKTKTGL